MIKTILYDEKSILNLQKFGIEIPALKSRKTKTLEALLNDKVLHDSKELWLEQSNPYKIEKADLERIHSTNYVNALFSDRQEEKMKEAFELVNADGTLNRYSPDKAEAPLSQLFHQVLNMSAGTYFAARTALEKGFCYYMGGGMHHGHKDFGHGFCPTNDIMITAARIIHEKKARSIWIIDVDAHKGDGTAEIAADYESVKTLSVHMADGWPLDEPEFDETGKLNPAFIPSDIDIPVKRGEENTYISRMEKGLAELESLDGEIAKPDLAIVLLGVDPYEKDELLSTDSLKLSEKQMLQRDQTIYKFLSDRNIPSAYTMAGGYGRYSWEAHYNFLSWVLKNG